MVCLIYIPQSVVKGLREKNTEWDEFHDAIVIDEMARGGCLGTVWGINGGASVGGPPIDQYGTDAQKQKYLAPLLRGLQRHCLCITEPAGRSPLVPPGEARTEKSS